MSADRFGESETPLPGSKWSTSETGASGASMGDAQYPDSALGTGDEPGTKDTAAKEARGVAREGLEGGKHVASVATDQVKEVASEAGQQAKSLLNDARSELMDHASSQQNRVAEQLQSLSDELSSMASKSEQDGLAADLARQASRRISSVAQWVSEREPGSLVTELKGFARNKPGTFLAVAAGTGLIAGRMTRGVKAGAPQDDTTGASYTPQRSYTPGLIDDMGTPGGTTASGYASASKPAGTLDDGYAAVPPPSATVTTAYPTDPLAADPLAPRQPGMTP